MYGMKCFGLIFLLSLFVAVAQAQDTGAVLHAADSLINQPEKALVLLNQALEKEPDSEELLKVRAEVYEMLKLYEKAAEDYKKIAQMSPDDETLWFYLGRSLFKSKQYDNALISLDNAIRLNPQYFPAYHEKIRLLLALNQNEEALKVSNAALMVGETATNYYLQGEIYIRLNSRQKAEWAYDKATRIDQGYIDAYIALADIAASMNKPMETLRAADEALSIDPDSNEALLVRSRGFALMDNYEEAIDDASYIIGNDPSLTDAYYWRGTYYQNFNKLQEAIRDFNSVLKAQPDNWKALAARADCFVKTGDKQAALADYRQLLENADNYPEKETIVQLAEKQIFEMNRESHIPELALTDPHPDNFNIQLPDNWNSITLKGIITDESKIKSLIVNDREITVTPAGDKFEFAATVELGTLQHINVEIADVYDNINKLTYHLVRHETGKPVITLFTPKSADDGLITLARENSTLYIEGKASDESAIKSIIVDGKAVDFDRNSKEPVFSAIIDIENKNGFSIKVTDDFDNSSEFIYQLEKISAAAVEADTLDDPMNSPAIEEAAQ
jgi:tetratricopeptide (TPR) repeat protein